MSIKPDWNEIAARIGNNLSDDELSSEWTKGCKNCLESIASRFGDDYKIEEWPNFSIMSNESDRYIHILRKVLSSYINKFYNPAGLHLDISADSIH